MKSRNISLLILILSGGIFVCLALAFLFQVIRFLNAKGCDALPRTDRVWSLSDLARRMVAALEKQERSVPAYLRALVADTKRDEGKVSEVALAMACFWAGEMKIGQIEGVLGMEAGWIDGCEVTRVVFDPLSAIEGRAFARRIGGQFPIL